MRSHRFRIFLALAWFLWTGVIVPIHTRGAIRVAGTSADASTCCGGDSSPSTDQSPDKHKPNPANCAICELTARLSTPVTFTIDLRPDGLLEVLPPPAPAAFVQSESPLVQSCRGPPVCLMG